MLVLLALSLALVIQGAPVQEQVVRVGDAVRLCRDIIGAEMGHQAGIPLESRTLERCLDMWQLLFQGLPKNLPVKPDKIGNVKTLSNGKLPAVVPLMPSRKKRQIGGEIGEDPGKRARKRRLGLPLGEVGEDPGKRMRARQQYRHRYYNHNPYWSWWYRRYYNSRARNRNRNRNRNSRYRIAKAKAAG